MPKMKPRRRRRARAQSISARFANKQAAHIEAGWTSIQGIIPYKLSRTTLTMLRMIYYAGALHVFVAITPMRELLDAFETELDQFRYKIGKIKLPRKRRQK
jgi:hypothetical protein